MSNILFPPNPGNPLAPPAKNLTPPPQSYPSVADVAVVMKGCSRLQGGMFLSIRELWQSVYRAGGRVTLYAVQDALTQEDIASYAPLPVKAHRYIGPNLLGWSPELKHSLHNLNPKPDVLSVHGMWTYHTIAAYQAARELQIPLISHPEGMLDPWALRQSPFRKRVARQLWENRGLREASCMRALCQPEAESFRALGLRNPIATIPNGLDLQNLDGLPTPEALEERFSAVRGRRIMLFLGRLHPKKGFVHFLKAWNNVRKIEGRDWIFLIAGPAELNHDEELKQLVATLGCEDQVLFTGALYGELKREALAAADLFVLPSFSEGFTMSLLEAAGSGIPCLITRPCNFPELATAGGAIQGEPTQDSAEEGLRIMLPMSAADLEAMGARGRALVRKAYTWDRIGADMRAVCQWLAGKGPLPDCVSTV